MSGHNADEKRMRSKTGEAGSTDGGGTSSAGPSDGGSGGTLPEPPEIVFSGGGGEWQDILRDRFVDLAFGAFVLFMVVMYVYQRFNFGPLIGQEQLDQHPTVKKAVALALALILGSVARKCGRAASNYMDQTIGMAFGLMSWTKKLPHSGGSTGRKDQ